MARRQRLPETTGAASLILEAQDSDSDSGNPTSTITPSPIPTTRVRKQCALCPTRRVIYFAPAMWITCLQGALQHHLQLLPPLNSYVCRYVMLCYVMLLLLFRLCSFIYLFILFLLCFMFCVIIINKWKCYMVLR